MITNPTAAKHAKAYLLLSLFSPDQKALIANALSDAGNLSGLEGLFSKEDLDQITPLPILSFLPKDATAEDIGHILTTFSVMAVDSMNTDKDMAYWRDMLMRVLFFSEKAATKAAELVSSQDSFHDIEIINKETGQGSTITQWLSETWKKIRHPFTDLDNLPTEKNYDMLNEMATMGEAISAGIKRIRLGLGTQSQILGPQFLQSLITAAEAGDIEGDVEMGHVHHGVMYNAISHPPYGDIETGALTRYALKAAKAIRKNIATVNAASPGKLALTRVVRGVPAALARVKRNENRVAPAFSDSGAPPPANPQEPLNEEEVAEDYSSPAEDDDV
jgi:hypothetical protein